MVRLHICPINKGFLIKDGSIDDPRERKANEFAAEILIPRNQDLEIAALLAKADVIRLADELKIPPGIVAGRFQRLKKMELFQRA